MRGQESSYEITTKCIYSKHKLPLKTQAENKNNSWNVKTDSEINIPYDTENVTQLNLIEF